LSSNPGKTALKRIFKDISKHPDFKGVELVFGAGPCPCKLMVIGEAPGRDEVKLKTPFVGKAGRFLIGILREVFGIERDEFYITNVVKFWPVIETKRKKTRPPTQDEVKTFIPFLQKEIKAVSPKAIIAVGKTAFSVVAPDENFVPGIWAAGYSGIPVMPVYHPAYILRKQRELGKNTKELKMALRKVRARLKKKQPPSLA